MELRRALAGMCGLGDGADSRELLFLPVMIDHEKRNSAQPRRHAGGPLTQQAKKSLSLLLRIDGGLGNHGLYYISSNCFAPCTNNFQISFQMHCFVVDDAEDPAAEIARHRQAGKFQNGLQTGFLADVFGGGRVATGVFGVAKEGGPVPANQTFKRFSITVLGVLEQYCVVRSRLEVRALYCG